MHRQARLVGLVGVCLAAATPAPAAARTPSVSVFPIPGGRVASPGTQIAFRGINPFALASIRVVGSETGVHKGKIGGDSDGDGGSFIPSSSFQAGETVTVTTPFDVNGASHGRFSFTIAAPVGDVPYRPAQTVPRTRGDVWRFRSRGDLAPAAVRLLSSSRRAAHGDIFLAPQFGPSQDGPEILDPTGNLVWFAPVEPGDAAADFRVQTYHGRPVLTWWQGYTAAGIGVGQDVIYDSSYRQIATVKAANRLHADLHEFRITPQGTALITAYFPVFWNASSVHGLKREIVLDSIVQEIDIPTGLLLFQWDSLDHVPLSDTYESLPIQSGRHATSNPFDYFHVNSVERERDGSLVISGRNTWAAYKVSHVTGAVIWALGGRHSSFRMGPGTSFAFQHDVRTLGAGDRYVTVFDDGAGPPNVHSQSRGLELLLNTKRRTATAVAQREHSPPLLSEFEGNVQRLPDADDFVGWGQQPYFSEYDRTGRLVLDGRFVGDTSSYRIYKFDWRGTPSGLPAVAASTSRRKTTVYASWNGATTVGSWRVLSGPSATKLKPTRTVAKQGFETATVIEAAKYVAIQALDSRGRVIATSSSASAG